MFTKRFLMGTIFASAIAWPAAARAASWHQFTTGSGACSQIAAGDGTSPWCLAQDIENGQYEIYWFDTHNNTWEDSLSAGVQLSVAYQCPGGVDYYSDL